jgi:hypothetical protein
VVLAEGATSEAGEVLIEASANIVVKAENMQVSVVRRPLAARELPLLL